MDALQVTQLIDKLKAIEARGRGDLIVTYIGPNGQTTPVSDVVVTIVGFGQLVEVR